MSGMPAFGSLYRASNVGPETRAADSREQGGVVQNVFAPLYLCASASLRCRPSVGGVEISYVSRFAQT